MSTSLSSAFVSSVALQVGCGFAPPGHFPFLLQPALTLWSTSVAQVVYANRDGAATSTEVGLSVVSLGEIRVRGQSSCPVWFFIPASSFPSSGALGGFSGSFVLVFVARFPRSRTSVCGRDTSTLSGFLASVPYILDYLSLKILDLLIDPFENVPCS